MSGKYLARHHICEAVKQMTCHYTNNTTIFDDVTHQTVSMSDPKYSMNT